MTKAYLEMEETKQLEGAAGNLRDKLLIRMLTRIGCRISEALALEVKDIDFAQSTVTIEHLKAKLKLSCPGCNARLAKSHLFCPGCGAKVEKAVAEAKEHKRVRTLPIDGDTLGLLRDYIKRGGPVSHNGRQLLFSISRRQAYHVVVNCARAAGLPDLANPETGRVHHVSPHRLRDAFAVRAVKLDDSGDGLRLLQEHLGHANIGTTMRYRKVAGEEHREWYDRLWGAEDQEG